MKKLLIASYSSVLLLAIIGAYVGSSNPKAARVSNVRAIALGDAEGVPCYTIINLGTLGGISSKAFSVNNNGDVVGWSYLSDSGGSSVQHAFLYTNGSMQDLGTLGGTYSQAYDINDSGQIVGEATTAPPFTNRRGFIYQNGSMQDVGSLVTGGTSTARGINDSGTVAGIALGSTGRNRAFRYSEGSMAEIAPPTFGTATGAHKINASGSVSGYIDFAFPGGIFTSHAGMHTGGAAMIDLGTINGQQQWVSEAFDINDSGQVVGWSEISSGGVWRRAFLYQNAAMQDLGSLGQHSEAYGINNDGDIVGASYSTNFNHAFIYRNGVMQDLNDFLPPNSGWELSEARAISDNGHIVGSGIRTGLSYLPAFLMSPCTGTNTNPGNNVQVQSSSGDATVTFSQVSIAGTTTFTAIDPNTAGTPPSGFAICPTCPAYDITTTAVYSAPVTVCLAVPTSVDDATFNLMELFHYENGVPENITSVRNTIPREVCGTVTTLSPFTLGSSSPTPSPSASPTPTATPTPTPEPPLAPSSLSAKAMSPTQIDLSWTDNSNNEDGFAIERCFEKGKCRNFSQIAQVGAGVTAFSDVSVQGGNAYVYQVRAFNAFGNSGYSDSAKARTPRR